MDGEAARRSLMPEKLERLKREDKPFSTPWS